MKVHNWRKEDYLLNGKAALGLAFMLPLIILLVLFGVKGIYPFGDRTFLSGDLYHQYMPFFSELMRKIRNGESLSFSWNVGIGSNFLALYVYYLASPSHFLALLAPESHLIEFISYLAVCKMGLAGWSCCYYLQKHYDTQSPATVLFSCFYALSGFMAAYNYNIMWLDCIVLLPLIVLGLERLVQEGKWTLYCVMLALSIYTNYYISIMICIFLVLYFVLLVAMRRFQNFWRSAGYFAAFSLLAGGLASALLIPEVCAILQTDFGDVDFPRQAESYFSVLDMLARHCMCVTTERGLDHWPNIYCGSAALLFLPLYVLNRKISVRERFLRLALMGFLLLSFGTNILDFMWHGMNYPDSLPARQSFCYIFLVLTASYDAFRHVKESDEQQILYGYMASVAFFLFCQKFVDQEDFALGVKFLTLVFVSVYAVLLYLYRTRAGDKIKQILFAVALTAVVAENCINTYDTSLATVNRSEYLEGQKDYKALYEWAGKQEEGFWRVEKFTRKTKNDGTLTGYPTASVFSSTLNSQVMDLYKRLGMRHSKVFYGYDGATAFTSALLNVNYMFGEPQRYESSLYEAVCQSGQICLYRARNTLPFGYVAPVGYDLPGGYTNNAIALQNQMVRKLGVEGKLFEEADSRQSGDDVVFTADQTGIYYAMVMVSGTSRIDAVGAFDGEESYNDLKAGSVLYLGQVVKDSTVTFTNGDEDDDTPAVNVTVYRMDESVLQKALALLAKQHLERVEYTSDRLYGEITLAEAGRLILSVPLEKGWRILINGQPAEAVAFGESLAAFDLEEGHYTIELHYVPQGQSAGRIVTAVSLILLILLLFLQRKRHRSAAVG